MIILGCVGWDNFQSVRGHCQIGANLAVRKRHSRIAAVFLKIQGMKQQRLMYKSEGCYFTCLCSLFARVVVLVLVVFLKQVFTLCTY